MLFDQLKNLFNISQDQLLKQEIILKKKQSVYFLLLNTKANAFNKSFIRDFDAKLTQIQKSEGAVALVTVSLSKVFSGGFDLKYSQKLSNTDQRYFRLQFINLIGRIVALPFPTLALVKGGAVAGGCIFALAHDLVFVGGEALFVLNQVDKGLSFSPGNLSVVKRRLLDNNQVFREMIFFGKKYNALQALQANLIDGIYTESESLDKIIDLALKLSSFGENRIIFKKIKQQLNKDIIEGCFNKQQAGGVVGEITIPLLPKL